MNNTSQKVPLLINAFPYEEDTVQKLLSYYMDLELVYYGKKAIHIACEMKNEKMIKYLMLQGADIFLQKIAMVTLLFVF